MIGSVTYGDSYFGDSIPIRTVADLEKCPVMPELLVFWGGEDVTPSYYGEMARFCIGPNPVRDERELRIIRKAHEFEIPMLGICRGAQLLCVADGGKLWQHVDNHAYGAVESHKIKTHKGEILQTNSAHHQMMRPTQAGVILATSHVVRSPQKCNGQGVHETDEPEVEACYFPYLNAVGIQGHPEWLKKSSDLTQFTYRVVKEFLNVDLS